MRLEVQMKQIVGFLFAVLISLLTSHLVALGQNVAFVGVNVVPMDQERVLSNHTVLVQNGRITAVGPADTTAVPPGALRIESRGKYLMPGLAEMHAHIPDERVSRQFTENVLFLFLANGVTTPRVFGMGGLLL
jgi:cytosine/adenosine deaminase-related metal-dependent hydrolase